MPGTISTGPVGGKTKPGGGVRGLGAGSGGGSELSTSGAVELHANARTASAASQPLTASQSTPRAGRAPFRDAASREGAGHSRVRAGARAVAAGGGPAAAARAPGGPDRRPQGGTDALALLARRAAQGVPRRARLGSARPQAGARRPA